MEPLFTTMVSDIALSRLKVHSHADGLMVIIHVIMREEYDLTQENALFLEIKLLYSGFIYFSIALRFALFDKFKK